MNQEHSGPAFNGTPKSDPGIPEFIPQPPGNSPRTRTSVTELVTANKGGKLKLSTEYTSGNTLVKIKMTLTVPKNAVASDTYITLTLDTANVLTNIAFSPSGVVFNSPALLDVEASGLDLTGFAEGEVDAWYVENGIWYYTVQVGKIKINVAQGKFKADNVEVGHFSQYAFGRGASE